MRGLLRASHFQPTLAVTVITGVLAAVAGRGLGTVAVVAAVLAGQLSVGWSNDWIDRDRDLRAGRDDKPIVSGAVAATVVERAAITALVLTVPLSLLSGWRAASVHLVAVLAAWAYNLGLKRTPVQRRLLPARLRAPAGLRDPRPAGPPLATGVGDDRRGVDGGRRPLRQRAPGP